MRPVNRALPLLVAASLGAFLLLPAGGSAATLNPEYLAAANKACGKLLRKDVRLFKLGIKRYKEGDVDKAAHLFIASQRTQLKEVKRVLAVPTLVEAQYDGRIAHWAQLSRGSARVRIRFSHAVLAGKSVGVLTKLDRRSTSLGRQAAAVAADIGFHC